MTRTVAVLGGGIAGLTVAHELAELDLDLDVTVYERNLTVGGKARSFPKPNTGRDGRADLPGEHGFRFFPGYYRHVPDTMRRIPFGDNPDGVFGNLVTATQMQFLRKDGPPVTIAVQFPKSRKELAEAFSFGDLGIPWADLWHFSGVMQRLLCSCTARRIAQYENHSWFEFTDGAGRSDLYRKYLADGMNQRTVAASGRDVSARTVGGTLARFIRDQDLVDVHLDSAIVEVPHWSGVGPRTESRETLFVNRTGSSAKRPPATTALNNFFLAADYVQTTTDLATMESANEAGRRAARGILERLGDSPERVQLFDLPELAAFAGFRKADALAWRMGVFDESAVPEEWEQEPGTVAM